MNELSQKLAQGNPTYPPLQGRLRAQRSGSRLVLTFMSFMMTWKSPPKALHSFSIPASIFPQARKNPQLPKAQTFTSSRTQSLDRVPQ